MATEAAATPGLILEPNIADGDGFYDELLAAHEGLDAAASHALNARLVLVLCNHVGDRNLIREALAAARRAGGAGGAGPANAASAASEGSR